MTLYERNAFNFYIKGTKKANGYRVILLDVPEIRDEVESIYTYVQSDEMGRLAVFAIGKVKQT